MLSNKMIDSFKVNESISNISFLLSPDTVISDLNNWSIQILIASSKGTFVKSDSRSNDAIKQFDFWLNVKHLSKGTKKDKFVS